MDTTLIYNQVRIPTDINASVGNIPSFPDSLHVFVGDVVNIAKETAETQTFWGMTPEWGCYCYTDSRYDSGIRDRCPH